MARVKDEDAKVWTKEQFWKTPGLGVETKQVKFSASNPASGESTELTATAKSCSFNGNLDVAVSALGGVSEVLEVVESAINTYLANQAKNAAKSLAFGLDREIARAIDAAVARFTQKRGVEPTATQREQIAAKVRATYELDVD